MDSGFFVSGFLLMYLYPFFVSNAAMVFGSKVLIQEVEKNPQKKYKKVQQLQMCQKMLKSQLKDALVKFVKTVLIVETAETVETVETAETPCTTHTACTDHSARTAHPSGTGY